MARLKDGPVIVLCAISHARFDRRKLPAPASGPYVCVPCQTFTNRLTAHLQEQKAR